MTSPVTDVAEIALPARLMRLPNWPAAMTRDVALAYTGVAEAQLRAWEKAEKVHFRPRGPRGAMLALRSELDAALTDLFTSAADDDFDFGEPASKAA